MISHFETSGIYPLSTAPAEGYGSDPLTRSGKVILSHVNGKHVKLEPAGHALVEDRADATKFEDHALASLVAAKLIEAQLARSFSQFAVQRNDNASEVGGCTKPPRPIQINRRNSE